MDFKVAVHFTALLICYIMVVANGDRDLGKPDNDYQKTTQTDDVILPEIHIMVRAYPKDGEKFDEKTAQKSMGNEEKYLQLPSDIQTQNNGNLLDGKEVNKPTTHTANLDDQSVSENTNIDRTENVFFHSDSSFTTKISNIVTLALSYATQIRDSTVAPDIAQSSDITDQMKDTNTSDTLSENSKVEHNRQTEFSKKVTEENKPITIQAVEGHEVSTSLGEPYNFNDNNTSTANERDDDINISTDNNNEDIINTSTANKRDEHKVHDSIPVNKSKLKIGEKIKYDTRNVLSSRIPESNKIRKNIDTKFRRKLKNTKNDTSWNMSLKKKINKLGGFLNDEYKDKETHKDNYLYNNDNADEKDDDSRGYQAKPWWKIFDGINNKKIETSSRPEDNKLEDNDMDLDIGRVSSGVDLDDDQLKVEGPTLDSGQIYSPGISSPRSKPIAEADLKTSDVAKMIHRYDTCDYCMISIYNTSHQCNFFNQQADELDKWARTLTDLLRYGCSGQGVRHDERCCHSPDAVVQTAVNEMSKVSKSMVQVLTKQCEKCSADCSWLEWTSWSNCQDTCGQTGYRNRSRSQIKETYGGRSCFGEDTQREKCPDVITEHGTWMSWLSWSSCSGTCSGTRSRIRRCTEPTTCSCFVPCNDNNIEVESCGDESLCCHSRTWATWGTWTECYGVGDRTRSRQKTRWRACEADLKYIDQPMCPQHCPGDESQTMPCCKTYTWSEWGSWSKCLGTDNLLDLETGKQCGEGCKNRTRTCLDGTCLNDTCYGDHIERIFCKLDPCCVPPVWTLWGSWSACSVSAGSGARKRSRYCQPDPDRWRSPVCRAGGCYGQLDDAEAEDCRGLCPKCSPPSWGTWESWTDCDFSQSRPRRTSRRRCINNSEWDPNCRHLQCDINHSVREEECRCDNPVWTEWSKWGPCDVQKVPAQRARHRVCLQSTNPSYCMEKSCIGPSEDYLQCCRKREWSPWNQWTDCVSRGYHSTRTRTRTCSQADPGCPDEDCEGGHTDTTICPVTNPTTSPPCDPGQWTHWEQWSSCDCKSVRTRFSSRSKISSGYTRRYLCPPIMEPREAPCECNECKETCEERKDGKYPSCLSGCKSYITCCQGQPIREDCKGDQHYDSLCQKCRKQPSPTCPTGQYDQYKDQLTIPVWSSDQCTDP